MNFCVLPFECKDFKWSTVNCRISAFSNFADPCFSKAEGTSLFSSVSDVFILSRRFFSMTPRRFFRLISWQLSFSIDDGLIWINTKTCVKLNSSIAHLIYKLTVLSMILLNKCRRNHFQTWRVSCFLLTVVSTCYYLLVKYCFGSVSMLTALTWSQKVSHNSNEDCDALNLAKYFVDVDDAMNCVPWL